MTHKLSRHLFNFEAVVLAWAASGGATGAYGHQWSNPTGGNFHTSSNWLEGAVPGPDDFADFFLSSAYTVTFSGNANTATARIKGDTVTFALNLNTYALSADLDVGQGSTGNLTVEGGTLTVGATARVGHSPGGAGTLTIQAGGQVDASAAHFVMVGDSGAMGHVVVTGVGSKFTAPYDLTLGRGEGTSGIVEVRNGGSFDSGGAKVGLDGFGQVTVSGPGSTWTNSTFETAIIQVGGAYSGGARGGTGNLLVENGAAFTGVEVQLGVTPTSSGSVTVTGAGSRLESVSWVGLSGHGSLVVADGGRVDSTGWIGIGDQFGSVGVASVTGLGSRWSVPDAILLGDGGQGTLTISGGGVVTSQSGWIGDEDDNRLGVGVATVSGPGSSWIQ